DLAPGGATLDGTFPKSPEWTFNFSPQLSFDAGDGELRLRADYSYRSKVFHDITNHPTAVQDGFPLLNARLAWFAPSDRWEVALFGTNLTDERYSENGIFIFGFGPTLVVAGRPREWGVSTRFNF
ncbi:MAG: TonB-dependent receptor, partial [bacterium]|nr:TonB-dependent receptor [bacterium]